MSSTIKCARDIHLTQVADEFSLRTHTFDTVSEPTSWAFVQLRCSRKENLDFYQANISLDLLNAISQKWLQS